MRRPNQHVRVLSVLPLSFPPHSYRQFSYPFGISSREAVLPSVRNECHRVWHRPSRHFFYQTEKVCLVIFSIRLVSDLQPAISIHIHFISQILSKHTQSISSSPSHFFFSLFCVCRARHCPRFKFALSRCTCACPLCTRQHCKSSLPCDRSFA